MDDISQRIARLSPEKRALLTQRLKERKAEESRALKILPRGADDPSPLSFGQQRMWFLDQFKPGQPFYNLHNAIRLTGPLDVATLEQSLNEIVRRHHVLRTTFATVDEQPVQILAPTLSLKLPVHDLQGLALAEQEAQVQRWAAQEAQKPFDLAQGPLLRVALLRLSQEQHVLLLTMHHIVSDLWSLGVFIRELALLYEAFAAGRASPLPDLPIQYADFAYWQRQQLQGQRLETLLAYWKQRLDGIPAILNLPTDRPRPAVQTPWGAMQSLVLPETLVEGLEALSRQEGVTVFMTLLAAFKVLLYRYTAQEDIVVGTPIAGRNQSETEALIGFFLNTLVLRTDLSGNPTFRELLGRVRQTALDAYAHADLPFEKLVEELAPERSLSYTPLFQVMFALQNVPLPETEFSGLTLSLMGVDTGTARFDLSLNADVDERRTLVMVYNTDLFDAATITRMLGHLQTLLEGALCDPDRRLADLPLLTQAEQQQQVDWNNTARDYPLDQCLHQLFEAQARRTPSAIAVVAEEGELSYQELDQRANRLAHSLQRLGIGPDGLVGICMERSLDMITGILGVLKAGGAWLPLDPDYPQERLGFMLKDARPRALLTQARLAARLPADGLPVVCLDSDWETIARESAQTPACEASAESLAYVIYTSGSSGQPKGVLIPHRGIVNRMVWLQEMLHITEADCILHKTPLVFDVAIGEIGLALLNGARLVMARPGGHLDSAYLVRLIAEHQITFAHFVPSMLNALLEERELEQCNASLRYVWCGGEVLPFELKERFLARLKARLYNGYGPTEASVGVTAWACEQDGGPPIVPIGRPIANTQIYILDPYLNPVPIRVPGELHIGGAGLGRGYLNRPDLTAEQFIPNPFLHPSSFTLHPSSFRLYKTGDLARYLPDGNIEFLGRRDYQVKVRGFRIELEEIEAVLRQHAGVRQAVVLARENEAEPALKAGKRLVAYLVAELGYALTDDELRHFLKEKLPEYMIPSAFVVLDTLPLTPSGKVNRDALPALDGSLLEHKPHAAPRSELEQIIADIWREVLEIDEVGIHDNFFDLGGHSLLLVMVRGLLQDKIGQDVPIAEFFEYPTISSLAQHLSQEQPEPSAFDQEQDRARKQREATLQQLRLGQSRERKDA